VAGASRTIFPPSSCRELYKRSGGVPRIINVIADRAMLGAYTQDEHEVSQALVRHAAGEVYGENPELRRKKPWQQIAALTAVMLLLIAAAVITTTRFMTGETGLPFSLLPDPVADSTTTAEPALAVIAAADETIAAELEALIENNPDKTDTRNAFASLFRLWGLTFDMNNDRACEQAQTNQLFCLFQRGSLAQIQKLNRPVILTLQDRAGMSHQVVLAELNERSATISLGETDYTVPVDEISTLWYGEYMLLWKPQIGAVKSFYPGMRDPDVVWLRDSLATIQGKNIRPESQADSDFFDESLEASVRDYQVAKRLNVDGLVGQQTQILINTDLGLLAPRLMRQN
jgi:general secretion pathway protein A